MSAADVGIWTCGLEREHRLDEDCECVEVSPGNVVYGSRTAKPNPLRKFAVKTATTLQHDPED